MRRIDVSNWKPFKLVDLFDITKGRSKETKEGVPLVTCTVSNNGKHKTKVTDNNLVKNILTVNSDGAPGYAFYQSDEVGVFTNVNILTPLFKITPNIGNFLATVLTKSLSPKFHYAKKCGLERLKAESILLPEKDGEIDFKWIEEFMLKITKGQEEIRKKLPKYKKGKLDLSTWKPFKIADLFDLSKGKSKETTTGKPLVTCATSNNGKHKTKVTDNNLVKDVITISGDGVYTGTAFYQGEEVGVFMNVNILTPKFNITESLGRFFVVVLTKSLNPKFHYAKKCGLERLKLESILLPEKDGQPDWNYMEEFMNNLTI